MAAYQQAGDFEVVNINGRIKKNGGNVVSYFCTPQGEVIHAVAGPARPKRLLREAQWAVATYQNASKFGNKNQARQAVESAHLAALGSNRDEFYHAVRDELPQARQQLYSAGRWHSAISSQVVSQRMSPPVTARRLAARQFGSDEVHQIMAAQPLAPIKQVYHELFEGVVNEDVNEMRGPVYQAAGKFKDARKNGRPLLLVLYRSKGEYDNYDWATTYWLQQVARSRKVKSLWKKFETAAIPLDQLAALSQLAEVPVYQIPRRSSPIVILARSNGEQYDAVSGSGSMQELAPRMQSLLIDTRFDRVDSLTEQGKYSTADSMLRQLLVLMHDDHARSRIRNRIAQLNIDWAQADAQDGKTDVAVRRLTRVKRMSTANSQIRELAAKRIGQLTSHQFLAAAK